MCFELDSEPPIPPGVSGDPPEGSRLVLEAGDGNRLRAYRARPIEARHGRSTGIVILPDNRGLFGFYERLAQRFAQLGIEAVAIDYFGRTAGTEDRGDDFESPPHVAQTTIDGVYADVDAGIAALQGDSVESIATIGFCFGGGFSFAQASREIPIVGVIGLYGILGGRPGRPEPIALAASARVPVLGLFGGADKAIPTEQVEEYDRALTAAGVEHSVHTYPGAPHSFFDRTQHEHAEICQDAWQRIIGFLDARQG